MCKVELGNKVWYRHHVGYFSAFVNHKNPEDCFRFVMVLHMASRIGIIIIPESRLNIQQDKRNHD